MERHVKFSPGRLPFFWTELRVSFWHTSDIYRRSGHETEAVFSGVDCGNTEASGTGHAGGINYPVGRLYGTVVLLVEEALYGIGTGAGAMAPG